MNIDTKYDWVKFYEEFANKLLPYKAKRNELIEKIKTVYKNINIKLPTLEKDNNIVDIDPFTIFGLFNKHLTDVNRIKILTEIKTQFSVLANVPTHFNSLPILNNQNSTYYWFVGSRGLHDIDNLWGLFENSLEYADTNSQKSFEELNKYFNLVINTKGNGNSKVTMGMYWLRPNAFINLDDRNEWFIYESGKMPKELVGVLPEVENKISAEKYFEICNKVKEYLKKPDSPFKDLISLSNEAWSYSEKVNQENKAKKAAEESTNIDADVDTTHYWLYSAGNNSSKWDEFYNGGIMAIGWGELGDLSKMASQNDIKEKMKEVIDDSRSFRNDAHTVWEFAKTMKPGDIVFVKRGMHRIIAKGVVSSDYKYDSAMKDGFNNIRDVTWTDVGDYEHPGGQAVMKTLTDITRYPDYVEQLLNLFPKENDDEIEQSEKVIPIYTKDDFLKDAYVSEQEYTTLVALLENDMNLVLEGAPGVGKTYLAKRLAYSIMGKKDTDRVEMVQFHQSYSYEDFIMGLRPTSNPEKPWEIKPGIFYDFCRKAEVDSENKYFFIIDEINRGNLSKIFGELFVLLEPDKRGNEIRLLYNNEKFSIPKNVYLIGTMNTADRSLALIDYALRRRFSFYDLTPAFDKAGFIDYEKSLKNQKLDRLIEVIKQLNQAISSDESLGEGFRIGHSYLCNLKNDSTLGNIIEYKIIPLLKEYWFDSPSIVNDWAERLRESIK